MKRFYLGGLLLLWVTVTQGQSYTFTELTGEYSDLTESIILEDADYDDENFNNIDLEGETIPFFGLDFNFGGINTYTVQPLGNVRVDNDSSAVLLDALRSLGIYPLDETTKLSYQIDGEPGSHIIKVEWKNHTLTFGEPGNIINFQIWVYQETGVIEFHYGPRSESLASGLSDEDPIYIGLLYAPDNFFGVYEKIWISGEIDDLQIDTEPISNYQPMLGVPDEGTIYRFTPTFLSTQNYPGKELLNDFILAPNPAVGSVSVQNLPEAILNVDVLDMQGKLIRQFPKTGSLEISDLESGIYFIRVETESFIGIKRLVKP
jgi:hypothetical protein